MGEMDNEFYSGVNDKSSNRLRGQDNPERNGRIFVRNISYKATKESLKEHFSKYGTVNEVNLLKRPDGKLVGCGFVHFQDVAMAEKAIEATNKKPYLDRPIHVAFAVQRKSYLQNRENNARTQFSANDHKKVIVKDEENDASDNAKTKQKNAVRVNRNARLIIRNVSFKANEETLKEHFQPYGEVLEVKLLKKPDGKLVGCAFVLFKNVPMAKKALLNTNMKPFLGRPISVDWAVAKNKYMQHQVNQQLELEEQVKKEEPDSDEEEQKPLNISADEVKNEIKSESDDDSSDDDDDNDESEQVQKSEDDDQSEQESDGEDDDDDMNEGSEEEEKIHVKQEGQRIKLNDAEDGCTVFVKNVPYSVNNDELKEFAERTGPIKYALICVDKMTEHSRGSGFVKFANLEHAETFLSLPAHQLKVNGQVLHVQKALKRENVQKDKKEAKDNRNLYLVKEGVVVAGTRAALGLSASDMTKRLALERSKTQMLRNLNRFVSRYRLVVSNLPASVGDARLRRVCERAAPARAELSECRVMRDLRTPPGPDGHHPSKGYGFVMFSRHEDALACLRNLNNNPDIFDKNNRPIVSFSIEDRTALNARKKRLEKSIANNPLAKKTGDDASTATDGKRSHKRKLSAPDESYAAAKRRKFGKHKFRQNLDNDNQNSGNYVKKQTENIGEYTGLTAKPGAQHKIRNNHKLRAQAEIHRQNVKIEKKKGKKSQKFKMAAKERVKQPKQKINKNPNKKRNKKFKSKSTFEMLRG